jgi:hypothetical protein
MIANEYKFSWQTYYNLKVHYDWNIAVKEWIFVGFFFVDPFNSHGNFLDATLNLYHFNLLKKKNSNLTLNRDKVQNWFIKNDAHHFINQFCEVELNPIHLIWWYEILSIGSHTQFKSKHNKGKISFAMTTESSEILTIHLSQLA